MAAQSTTTRPKNVKNVWIVRYPNRCWAVQIEGQPNPIFIYRTQSLAIAHGLTLARNRRCELIIQNRRTQIREKNSYGNDPYPPRG